MDRRKQLLAFCLAIVPSGYYGLCDIGIDIGKTFKVAFGVTWWYPRYTGRSVGGATAVAGNQTLGFT